MATAVKPRQRENCRQKSRQNGDVEDYHGDGSSMCTCCCQFVFVVLDREFVLVVDARVTGADQGCKRTW